MIDKPVRYFLHPLASFASAESLGFYNFDRELVRCNALQRCDSVRIVWRNTKAPINAQVVKEVAELALKWRKILVKFQSQLRVLRCRLWVSISLRVYHQVSGWSRPGADVYRPSGSSLPTHI